MFEDLQKPTEDIFEKTDEAAPHVAPPTAQQTVQPAVQPVVQSVSPSVEPLQKQSSGGSGSHIKTIIIILAILVVIGGAFLISWRILSSRTPVTPQEPGAEETTKTETQQPSSAIETEPAPEIVQPEVDTDKDGLSDLQEAQLGTSPKSSDTDGDFLFDREELEVYGTNPLNSDSDGDGFLDGNEVKAGYDPNGPGKLLEVPAGS
ncbi:hypothetical protein HYV69_02570 [Candidatus Uhrbacteria bacterium]|nr:hypothetical protein [Candidatus Uhrbacteria bacterium]